MRRRWRRRATVLCAISALAVASLCGCAPRACAGAAQYPPGVWLDPSPWLAAHPGSTLTVCLDGDCKRADATTAAVLQLVVPYRSPAPTREKASYPLTITSSGSIPLDIRTSVTLRESEVRGPCGTQTWWSADARLTASGRLTILHRAPGPFAPQADETKKLGRQ